MTGDVVTVLAARWLRDNPDVVAGAPGPLVRAAGLVDRAGERPSWRGVPRQLVDVVRHEFWVAAGEMAQRR